jgi:hypothetical protein
MDMVLDTLSSHGYQTVFVEGWEGAPSFGGPTWVQNWVDVTRHYKGYSRILAFGIFGEPTAD